MNIVITYKAPFGHENRIRYSLERLETVTCCLDSQGFCSVFSSAKLETRKGWFLTESFRFPCCTYGLPILIFRL